MPRTIASASEESSLENTVVITVQLVPEIAATPADSPPAVPTPRNP